MERAKRFLSRPQSLALGALLLTLLALLLNLSSLYATAECP